MWRRMILGALLLGGGVARAELAEECMLPEVIVTGDPFEVHAPADLSLTRAGQALVTDGRRYQLLQAPGCRLTEIALGPDPSAAVSFVVPGGRLLFRTEKGWYVTAPAEPPRRVEPPAHYPESQPRPILSNDGAWIAWVQRRADIPPRFIEGKGTYYAPSVLVRSLSSNEELVLPMPAGVLANEYSNPEYPFILLNLDMAKREVTVAAEDLDARTPRFLTAGAGGVLRWGPITPAGLTPGPQGMRFFRRLGDGWVAWDGLLFGRGAPKVAWSLASGKGTHEVRVPGVPFQHPEIDGAAVTPDGKYLAVSVGLHTRMKLSSGRVYVVRLADQSVVVERSVAAASAGPVAFLGNDLFCYSGYDEKSKRRGTFVLRLPK